MEAKTIDAIGELVEKWKTDAAQIESECAILRRAADVIGDGSLKHGIELWEMKLIRLQRCIIELQHAQMIHGWIRVPGYERVIHHEGNTPNC